MTVFAPASRSKMSMQTRWSEDQILKKARKMARSLATTKEERGDLEMRIIREILVKGREDLEELRKELQREIRGKKELLEQEVKHAAEAATAKEEEELIVEGEIMEEDALYKAICDDKWERTKALLGKEQKSLTSKITASGKTPFHVAALFGHVNIVEELLKLLKNPEFLETVDEFGHTPLLIATVTGSIQVAKCLVEKNSRLLGIPNSIDELPATLAFLSGHREMGRYLYSQTPLEYLQPHNDRPLGATLLRCCLETQCFDVAHHLLSQCQELLFASDDEGWKPIYGIATMNTTIPSPTEFVFWKRWIYNYIDTNSTPSFESACLPVQHENTREKAQGKLACSVAAGHGLLQWLVSYAYNFRGITKIKELKLLLAQANEIVELVCKNASKRDQVSTFADALFRAAEEGNVEFVVRISKANPEILLSGDNSFRNIFYHAIRHRQDRVFNLIHKLRFKVVVASSRDRNGNSLLHAAARRAPASLLNRIYGPTLQMQRELQWFKEVEKVVTPTIRKARNNDGLTAEELFKEKHKGLMEQGEKWIKDTASSCSLVGTLIVTIMFTAAFTVPGGNNQTFGFPIFLTQPFFKVFIFSTILSLVSSSTSVLMFLAILTSHYSEEKFLKSLPSKLILGLSSLFISILGMMVAFLSTIHLMLKHTNYSWGLLPIIMLASVPIFLFVLSQFTLLRHSVFATYGSIFNNSVKQWP